MSWPKTIIFAVIMGIYTGLMALLVPERYSFHDIAVTEEAWILLAILVMINCGKPLEAAFKTFVFFLISQPIVYLVQVPFNDMGFGLFGYYRYWFYLTLATFPAAFIGWFVKKDNFLAGLILSPMLVLLVMHGVGYVNTCRLNFPNHLLSAIYCFLIIPVFIFGIFTKKEPRIAAGIVTLIALAFFIWRGIANPEHFVAGNVLIAEETYDLDTSWTIEVEDDSVCTAAWDDAYGRVRLMVYFKKAGTNIITLTEDNGAKHRIEVSCDEQKNINEKILE